MGEIRSKGYFHSKNRVMKVGYGIKLKICLRHTTAEVGDKIYIFGGTDGNSRLNDLFAYSVRTNKLEKLPAENAPSPRSGAQSIAVGHKIFYFGGYHKKGTAYFNELYVYDTFNHIWYSLNPLKIEAEIGQKCQ